MELRQVRHFVAAAETRNISRAAARVGLSQPALTRSIKALEVALQTRLLERHQRGCTLTPGGARFLAHAQQILHACGRAEDELSARRGGACGDVRFGISSDLSGELAEAALDRVLCELPDVRVCMFEGFHEEVVTAVQAGRIDFALTTLPLLDGDTDLIGERLQGLQERVFAGATHPLAARRGLCASDLVTARWVIADCRDSRERFQKYFLERRMPPPPALTTNSLAIVKSLVTRGSHLSILADRVVSREVQSGLVKPLKVPAPRVKRPVGLLYLRQSLRGRDVQRAMDLVRNCCSSRKRRR